MGILIKPIVTEKYARLNEKGQYAFSVDLEANKVEIKKAVEKEYNVNVERVNTYVSAGKRKSRMTKSKVLTGFTSATKKAVITVAKGEVIDIYSGI